VKTRAVGHLRDVRRLVVALSRARLGLYVFARVSLFRNCYELSPAFSQLIERPLKLYLATNEMYPPQRKIDELPETQPFIVEDMPHMAHYVYQLYNKRVEEIRSKTQGYVQKIPIQPPPVQHQEVKPTEDQENRSDEEAESREEEESQVEMDANQDNENVPEDQSEDSTV
jgi:intron-binding protein aquarius